MKMEEEQKVSVDELASGLHSGTLRVVQVMSGQSIRDSTIKGLVGTEVIDLLEQNYETIREALREGKIYPTDFVVYRCSNPFFHFDGERLGFSGDLLNRCRYSPLEFVMHDSVRNNEVVALRYDNHLIIRKQAGE